MNDLIKLLEHRDVDSVKMYVDKGGLYYIEVNFTATLHKDDFIHAFGPSLEACVDDVYRQLEQ